MVMSSEVVQKPKNKGGRPTKYNDKLAAEICERLSVGESLHSICDDDHIPSRQVVLGWAMDKSHKFYDQYAHARKLQAENMANEIMDIADDGRNDFVERVNRRGEVEIVADHEHINRSRLRVDARKWIASRLLPKVYGDRQHVEIEGTVSMVSVLQKARDRAQLAEHTEEDDDD